MGIHSVLGVRLRRVWGVGDWAGRERDVEAIVWKGCGTSVLYVWEEE